MTAPVAPPELFVIALAATTVILAGAGYAASMAWARIRRSRWALALAVASCALLAWSVFILADAANLQGSWRIVATLMLIGYLLAPLGIWRLCVATHGRARHAAMPKSVDAPSGNETWRPQ